MSVSSGERKSRRPTVRQLRRLPPASADRGIHERERMSCLLLAPRRRFAVALRCTRLQLLLVLLSAACASSKPVEHPPQRSTPAAAQPGVEPMAVAPAEEGLYSADAALRDVLSGELEYVGTGHWPGIARLWTCVFHNDRVIVVDVYCSVSDSHAVRIDVLSPQRGYVRIYAEADGPISVRDRALYFSFNVASEPPAEPATGIPPLALTMSYEQLHDYDQHRYDAFLPGCYGGTKNREPIGGCLGPLAARKAEWTSENRAFLEHASGDWYRVVRDMRALAIRYGRDP
jgi:hypothetical protein